jgi:hypothetical protein
MIDSTMILTSYNIDSYNSNVMIVIVYSFDSLVTMVGFLARLYTLYLIEALCLNQWAVLYSIKTHLYRLPLSVCTTYHDVLLPLAGSPRPPWQLG